MGLRTVKAIIAATFALPLAATYADELSYRGVDVAIFTDADVDAGDEDINGDGLQIRGSLPVYQNWFALAELQDLDLDRDVDVSRILIGAGAHWPINNKYDIVARFGFAQYTVEAGPFDDDDTGLFVGVRARGFVAPRFELEGGVEHVQADVGGLDDDTYLVAEGRYHFTPQLSVGVIINAGGDVSLFGAQGRFSF
jgi:hypothetical protein